MRKVVIIDYDLGNLFSVEQACKKVGIDVVVSQDPNVIKDAKAIILPGVGAYKAAMDNLRSLALIDPIKEHVALKKPFLGICLGLQLLFDKSDEFGSTEGLGIIHGVVKRFPDVYADKTLNIPHVGWNKATIQQKECSMKGIADNTFFYFVHSYYVVPEMESDILTLTNYCGLEYCSSIERENIFATQFHPEKSAEEGLKIYRNWAEKNELIC